VAFGKHDHEGRRHGVSLVFNRDQDVAQFCANLLPVHMRVADIGPFTTIGIADGDGAIIAGCVFHNFRRHDIEVIFCASTPRWATRGIMAALFDYPFNQLGCVRITSIASAANQKALDLNRKTGFKIEGRARKGYDGVNDAIIMGMLKDECIWLGRKTKRS
jgi:RimJ/RimL family protein N-acetyltransferase